MKIAGLCLFLLLPIADAGTIFNVSGTNITYGSAQAVPLNPDLVVYQMAPNYSLGTAQQVSPLYYSEQGFGSVSTANQSEYFSVPVTPGQTLSFRMNSTTPASQPTELLLYDANGNLVAIAAGNGSDGRSSLIDYTIPTGDGGNWVVQATSVSPNNFGYDLQFTSPLTYTTDVLGALTNPSEPGYYAVSANVGDPLHFSVVSTSPLLSPTELLLYDANGNLVAIADGNASDGLGSIIDYTVPGGDAGAWVIEVAGSANVPNPATDLFSYDLTIQGATGLGPVDPTAVATPEPSSGLLLGTALAGLSLVGRSLSRS